MRRKPVFSTLYLILGLLLMYLPIVIVMIYSVNESKISSVWDGFSLRWYEELFRDRAFGGALVNSLILGVLSSAAAAVIGTLGAIGTARSSFFGKGVMAYIATLPMLTPEIILGMIFLAFFSLISLHESKRNSILLFIMEFTAPGIAQCQIPHSVPCSIVTRIAILSIINSLQKCC